MAPARSADKTQAAADNFLFAPAVRMSKLTFCWLDKREKIRHGF
jgi:hypothetical protein